MLVHLPNSRAMELESDVIGLELMARAGYDPRNASSIWRKMQQVSGGQQGA
jgi:predicted Zn-dependent protease